MPTEQFFASDMKLVDHIAIEVMRLLLKSNTNGRLSCAEPERIAQDSYDLAACMMLRSREIQQKESDDDQR